LSDGRRQIVNFMLPGDCFDLQAALSARSDHAVVALTPVRLRRASVQAFLAAVRANAALASAFWWVALQEEAILREQIVRIGKRGARERVAHLLLELRRRQLAAGLDEAVASQAPVTREVLADALGLSRVHVSRAVAALVNSGLVSVRQRMVTVEDYDGLVALCGFDAEYLRLSGTTMLPEMGMDESSVM
jgi:CRP-like cAMP-binding protein